MHDKFEIRKSGVLTHQGCRFAYGLCAVVPVARDLGILVFTSLDAVERRYRTAEGGESVLYIVGDAFKRGMMESMLDGMENVAPTDDYEAPRYIEESDKASFVVGYLCEVTKTRIAELEEAKDGN